MSEMPVAIARRVQSAVRDAMSTFRAQARTGPVTKKVTDDILFRGAHEIIQALGQEPRDTRVLLWPSTVRLMLATFLEIDATEQPLAGGGESTGPNERNIT